MALTDYLKKVGILEDDTPADKAPAPQPATKAQPMQAAQTAPAAVPAASVPAVDHPIIPEVAESLLADLDAIRTGIDTRIKSQPESQALVKFLGIVNGMKNSVPDEGQRFKAAAEVIGIKFDDLVSSISVVGPTLDAEKSEFEETFVKSVNAEIAQTQTQAKQLATIIDQKSEELKTLNSQRAAFLAQTIKKQAELDKAAADFKSVLSTVASDYDELASKLERHLKG